MLAEYLYVDEPRLDSYVEQLCSQGLTVYDKLAELTVELSSAGPKVGGAQKRPGRPMTSHEKIRSFMSWVGENGGPDGSLFKCQTVLAVRALLPGKMNDKPLSLWVSRDDTRGLTTFLVEDFRIEDYGSRGLSSGSALDALVRDLEQATNSSGAIIVQEHIPEKPLKRRIPGLFELLSRETEDIKNTNAALLLKSGQFDELESLLLSRHVNVGQALKESLPDIISRDAKIIATKRDDELVFICIIDGLRAYFVFVMPESLSSSNVIITRAPKEEAKLRFVKDPLRLLEESGAILGSPRRIDTLYRLRHFFAEECSDRSVTGYPIFICANPSPWGPGYFDINPSDVHSKQHWLKRLF